MSVSSEADGCPSWICLRAPLFPVYSLFLRIKQGEIKKYRQQIQTFKLSLNSIVNAKDWRLGGNDSCTAPETGMSPIFGGTNIHLPATYFGAHQGTRVLTHTQIGQAPTNFQTNGQNIDTCQTSITAHRQQQGANFYMSSSHGHGLGANYWDSIILELGFVHKCGIPQEMVLKSCKRKQMIFSWAKNGIPNKNQVYIKRTEFDSILSLQNCI